MNLADMLSYSDIDQLSHIAKHYDCECNVNSKRELIQSILRKANQREVYEHVIAAMSIEELRFLNSLLFEQQGAFFSLEELIARVKQTNFAEGHDDNWNPRDVISKFKQRGWLFNGYSSETKYLFHVPQDLKNRFSRVLSERFQQSIVISDEPLLYRDEQSLMQEDIIQFLNFIAAEDILMTKEGCMYKKPLSQLLERFAVREEPVHGEVWRFGYGRRFKHYPNRLSFIYDYCYYKGYFIEDEYRITITDKGTACSESPHNIDPASLFHYWLSLYGKPIKNLTSFVYWIYQLAQQWVTVNSISDALIHLIKPFYYDAADMILEKRIIQMMIHLGLLRIGHHETDIYVIQMTEQGTRLIGESFLNQFHNRTRYE